MAGGKRHRDKMQKATLKTFDMLHEEGFEYLADNSYIKTGYRVHYSFIECAKSVFQLHNETLNVWTHMIGSVIFIALFIGVILDQYQTSSSLSKIPYLTDGHHTIRMFVSETMTTYHESLIQYVSEHYVPRWPIYVFITSAVICLLSSAIFHLMYVYSRSLYFFLSRLDYAGIAVLIAGSFFPMIYYSFYCHPWLLSSYLTAISILSGLTFGMSLMPAFGTAKYLFLRTSVFVGLGGFGVVPLLHLIWKYGIFDDHVKIMIQPLGLMAALYLGGAVIYATRFPERFYPGRFDVFLSSHQLWHVCVVLAALVHYVNAIQHYEWRWLTECNDL